MTGEKLDTGKLTDAQLAVLSRAARRRDGALTRPDNLKGKAADRLATSLISKGLVREVGAKPGMPVWRRDDEGSLYALVITKLGRAAIDAEEADDPDRAVAAAPRKAVAPEPAHGAVSGRGGRSRTRHNAAAKSRSKDPGSIDAGRTLADRPSPEAPRPGSKLAAVIALLQSEAGSSIDELSAATGWLPHTTRAALTGLRKRGYAVERWRSDDGGSTYRIAKVSASPIAA